MKDWQAASDKIRRRNATAIIESISVDTPFNFSLGVDTSDVPDFLESEWLRFESSPNTVFSLVGRDVNLARDLLISITKYFHVVENARKLRARGALTWMIVDAYHAALLGARVLTAFHGVLSYSVRNRTVLMDYRPNFGSPDEKKRFLKEYKGMEDPVRLLCPTKQKLDQRETWSLLQRLCRISDNDKNAPEGKLNSSLQDVAGKPLSTIRNKILYDSVYWTWFLDFSETPIDPKIIKDRLDSNDEPNILVEGMGHIHKAVNLYSSKLFNQIGIDQSMFPDLGLPPIYQRDEAI
jgi:hypothetical protein